jgi:hypothetical protein
VDDENFSLSMYSGGTAKEVAVLINDRYDAGGCAFSFPLPIQKLQLQYRNSCLSRSRKKSVLCENQIRAKTKVHTYERFLTVLQNA